MSFEEVWPRLTALRSDDAPAATLAWKVVYARRAQPLLLPTGSARRRGAAVSFFVRSRRWRWWARALLALDRWMPDAGLLPEVRIDHFAAATLFGDAAHATAIYVGSPGPLQKLTILCPCHGDEPARVAKVSLHASADAVVAREAQWLRTLGAAPTTEGFVPRLLDDGALPGGRRYIVMTALPEGATSLRFGPQHRAFLAALAEKGRSEHWSASAAVTRLRERIRAVCALLGEAHCRLLEEGLLEIEASLERRPLPGCLLHGDFAPWNVRLTPERVFVFDWEYAQTSGNPLQDYLHFHLMPRVLQTRRTRVGPVFMRSLLKRAAAYAGEAFGADSGVVEVAGPLAVHYLLDTISFYVEASGYMDARHPVMRAYLQLLERRQAWLPRVAEALPVERIGYGG